MFGKVSLHGLAKGNDVCRNLIRVWIEKYERGEFDDEIEGANLLEQDEAWIAGLERMVERLCLENELLKGASRPSRPQIDCRLVNDPTGPLASPSPKDVA